MLNAAKHQQGEALASRVGIPSPDQDKLRLHASEDSSVRALRAHMARNSTCQHAMRRQRGSGPLLRGHCENVLTQTHHDTSLCRIQVQAPPHVHKTLEIVASSCL